MDILRDRRAVVVCGAALALAAGLFMAVVLAARHDAADDAAAPASQGGLVVQTGHDANVNLDPQRPLRCFVNGRLVGEMTVADCARKNGVTTGALDVGVDANGGLAAAKGPTPEIIPPPPPAPPEAAPDGDAAPVVAQADEDDVDTGPAKACWGYSNGAWSRGPSNMTLGACVQSLFAGQCVSPGAAAYGRWGDRTLRLAMGRVEASSDSRTFRPLPQQLDGCGIATTP